MVSEDRILKQLSSDNTDERARSQIEDFKFLNEVESDFVESAGDV